MVLIFFPSTEVIWKMTERERSPETGVEKNSELLRMTDTRKM